MKNIFSINYQEKMLQTLKKEVFEAKADYIRVAEQKVYYDSMLEYQRNKLVMLTDMLIKMKGPQDEKDSCITTVSVGSSNRYTTKSQVGVPNS